MRDQDTRLVQELVYQTIANLEDSSYSPKLNIVDATKLVGTDADEDMTDLSSDSLRENEHKHENNLVINTAHNSPLGFRNRIDSRRTLGRRTKDISNYMYLNSTSVSCPGIRTLVSSSHVLHYKGVRALSLFESPQTPKTLSERTECSISSLETQNRRGPTRNRLWTGSTCRTPRLGLTFDSTTSSEVETLANTTKSSVKSQGPTANINPFTPTGMMLEARTKKRRKENCRSIIKSIFNKSMDEISEEDSGADNDDEDAVPTKMINLSYINTYRYNTEFLELCQIGCGEFGSVYKCINRLDGCEYAIKKSRNSVEGTFDKKVALNEVYAHAVLGKHPHVVRYYSAWTEDQHMIIQNEYCNGGSLADAVTENTRLGRHFTEEELTKILLHVAEGLKYIHSQALVHMNIKPGNIFISRNIKSVPTTSRGGDSSDDGFEDDDNDEEEVTYKIGNLGHVTSTANPQVEEGYCQYLPTEILHKDYSFLPKADIFALGLTIFEAAGGGPLPKNGEAWHLIRGGYLPTLNHCSYEFNKLLMQMIQNDPESRPPAAGLIHHPVAVSHANKTKSQLRKELNAEKFKNELLSRQLQEAARCLQGILLKPSIGETRANRVVKKKLTQSKSTTKF
ncbi:wee1-like protein kinase 2 [Tachypleus tridentatus]|uniref:wee1-like protein kinase 2 n=1 Tax=Tachypleus tridentatus TaxID=6853 RepID=UPI003FCF1E81